MRRNLHRRGYPNCAMPELAYDPVRRAEMIKKLHDRERKNIFKGKSDDDSQDHTAKGKELVVLKCAYSPHIKKLKLHCEYRKLLRRLRQEVGEGLLDSGRLVVAHPVRTNAFIATYACNFPHDNIACAKERDTGIIREGAVNNV